MESGAHLSSALHSRRHKLPLLMPRTAPRFLEHGRPPTHMTKPSKSCRVRMEKPCLECPICMETYSTPVKTNCGHVFCFLCLFHPDVQHCPVCRSPISIVNGDFSYDSFSDLNIKIFGTDEAIVNSQRRSASRIQSFVTAWRRHYCTPISCEQNGNVLLNVDTVLKTFNDDALRDGKKKEDSTRTSETLFRKKLMTFSYVDESSEVYFENGYMKRRAPSIVVLRGDDGHCKGLNTSAEACSGKGMSVPVQHDWRRELSNRVSRCLGTQSGGKLPILTGGLEQTDEDGDVVRFTGANAPRTSSDPVCIDPNEFVTIDDGDADLFESTERAAEFQHTKKQQHSCRVMSADTRLQSDLRRLVKSQSRLVCLTNAKSEVKKRNLLV